MTRTLHQEPFASERGAHDLSSLGDFQFGRNFGDLFEAPATNTFLVKFSRWLNF